MDWNLEVILYAEIPAKRTEINAAVINSAVFQHCTIALALAFVIFFTF